MTSLYKKLEKSERAVNLQKWEAIDRAKNKPPVFLVRVIDGAVPKWPQMPIELTRSVVSVVTGAVAAPVVGSCVDSEVVVLVVDVVGIDDFDETVVLVPAFAEKREARRVDFVHVLVVK